MQYLEAKIPIPDDCVIITKIEYEELKKADDLGQWMTLQEVLNRTTRKYDWFTQKILKNPKYRNKIDIERNSNGFVYYPGEGNDKYVFLRSKTLEFLENNFAEIMKK
ncbi:DUF771 domain-containing protein [Enterococcus avium]|uniref:DUF771 domain-containing protein n=1 Tax=Enterococcus avium TaxID=33945 RepID=UPI002891EBC2|nr:DUF771 domain-containing protein [Enterococcus avium]MDT2436829.1 DUF771 domain-containing protein [Enterococcus avium]MDT2466976.1 DUF771 domain-containing protein [Enterococcus avium]MDT2485275.1 DUF771 domain-containing protein [Enterococcus avium]MDT2506380.1 DUF771 domain-containing protein [Enterococcus avium]MDT2511863.1 DUF771 domain-containing protein [Enterococcus avium]